MILVGKTVQTSSSRRVAFVVVMAALSNILGLPPFVASLGVTNIHFLQIPIILTALALGAVAGGLVGLIGATTMALTLPVPNLYLLPGNAILGFVTGLLYSALAKHKWRSIISQTISVIGAYVVQAPYVYFTDVYLARMPQPLVVTIVFTLLVEDLISVFFSHIILYRISIPRVLQKTTVAA